MVDFQPVAKVGEVPDCGAKPVVAHGEPVALFRVGDEVFAISDVCTHEETELHSGDFDCEDLEIECPLHGSKFNVQTGEVRILPATRPVATFDVKIDGDLVLVGPKRQP